MRNDEVQPPVMEAIQAMWSRELGIHVTLATLEQKTWLQNQQTLNYSISTAGWAGDFLDPVTFLDLFVTGGGNNWTGWGDGAYDTLIAAGGPRDAIRRRALRALPEGRGAPPRGGPGRAALLRRALLPDPARRSRDGPPPCSATTATRLVRLED